MDVNGAKAVKKNEIGVQVAVAPQNTLRSQIEKMIPELHRAMPSIGITAERMARTALTALNANPKLYECEGKSFLAALVQSATLGLLPNTPLQHAYLIPYGKQVQFQVGYMGILELAYRTGEYAQIYAKEVYENDKFEFSFGLEPKLEHIPAREKKGEPIYYYAVYKLKSGGYSFEVMSKEDIIAHSQKYSQAVQKGWTSPWKTDFIPMAKKTVLKQLLKYAPKSTEISKVVNLDETTSKFNENMSEVIPEYGAVIEAEPVKELIPANEKYGEGGEIIKAKEEKEEKEEKKEIKTEKTEKELQEVGKMFDTAK